MTGPWKQAWLDANRAGWDERVAIHTGPGGYDLAALRAGTERLNAIEQAELPDVAGLRVLHLQCHFGRDSLMLAQRGASVVGLDFSGPAIATATALAAELNLDARFVQADLYDAPAAIGQPAAFDLVFVTWGAINWLPDIAGWARVVAHFLRPGGRLYLAEQHPAALVFDDAARQPDGRPGFFAPYFGTAPVVSADEADYVDPTARVTQLSFSWIHPLGAIVTALIEAGLTLEWLREHDAITWRMFACLVADDAGLFRFPDRPWLPLAFSLLARRV